jgi:peptidyl-prolyl cis-trans isomerase A (cyclophilin A)
VIALLSLVATATAGKAPAALSEPVWLDLDPLRPRICVSMVPGAGRFKKKDAEGWSDIRRMLESGELSAAIRRSDELKRHPAQRTVRAAAYILGKGQAIDLRPLVEKYPDDACLSVMAASVALKRGDVPGMIANVERAYAVMPDQPDVAELYALAGSTATERKERFEAAVEASPNDLSLRYSVAQLAESDGDFPTAVAGYRKVYDLGYTEVSDKLEKMALQTGDLDTYLTLAIDDTSPVRGPGFEGVEDRKQAYLDWLGLESITQPLYAVLETSQGDLVCQLWPDNAPVTVMNFVGLARGDQTWTRNGREVQEPLYDDTLFHRVIPEFMVQAGDPDGTGRGSPGYRFADEPTPRASFDRPGLLGMANSGADTNGSQFFITEVPTPHLSGKHTIFGQCEPESVELVKRIARVPRGKSDKPDTDVMLRTVRITTDPSEKPIPPEEAEPDVEGDASEP